MFYDNLACLCDLRGTTPTTVGKECGISANAVSNWKSGKTSPNSDIVIRIAEYLGVSTDYLLLGKEPELSDKQQQLLNLFNQLSEENQAKIIERAETLLDMQV